MTRKYHEKPVTYIRQVSLNVANLDRSIQFYKQVIGFQLLEQTERKATLTANGVDSLLALHVPENPHPKQRQRTGLYHFAILLPKRKDLANFLQHLRNLNIPFGASDHSVSEAIYLNDPDGNGIEVYRDRPDVKGERAEDRIHMTTDPLDQASLLQEVTKEWTELPEDTILGHIHLHVSDLEKSRSFYEDGLNFDLITKYPGALFMSSGGYHHHLGLNIWNGEGAKRPKVDSVGLKSFTIVIKNEKERKQLKENLEKMNVLVEKVADEYVVEDPSGNVIRLAC